VYVARELGSNVYDNDNVVNAKNAKYPSKKKVLLHSNILMFERLIEVLNIKRS